MGQAVGRRRDPDTAGLATTLHRHWRSVPTRMPIRGLHITSPVVAPSSWMTSGRRVSGSVFCAVVMPSATVRLPGPRHSSWSLGSGLPLPPLRSGPPAAHQCQPVDRLERADQHGRWRALRFGHGVDEIVQPVIQIDVGDAGRAVERRIARGRAGRRMTRRIVLADVGLDLDDAAGGDAVAGAVLEHLARRRSRATSSVGRA